MFGFKKKKKPEKSFVYLHFTGPGQDTQEERNEEIIYTHYCPILEAGGQIAKYICQNPNCRLVYCAHCHECCPKCGWWCASPERGLASGFAIPGFYRE